VALDATSLRNAVARLREGLARHRREPHDERLRDGLIQRFEFADELAPAPSFENSGRSDPHGDA
jgi:hypothetical protein